MNFLNSCSQMFQIFVYNFSFLKVLFQLSTSIFLCFLFYFYIWSFISFLFDIWYCSYQFLFYFYILTLIYIHQFVFVVCFSSWWQHTYGHVGFGCWWLILGAWCWRYEPHTTRKLPFSTYSYVYLDSQPISIEILRLKVSAFNTDLMPATERTFSTDL